MRQDENCVKVGIGRNIQYENRVRENETKEVDNQGEGMKGCEMKTENEHESKEKVKRREK